MALPAWDSLDAFFRSKKKEAILDVELPAPAARKAAAQGFEVTQRRFSIRLIRVTLPSGQNEFLATSLLDSTDYPACEFADLYHRRWRVVTINETA